jgi:cytochrome c553
MVIKRCDLSRLFVVFALAASFALWAGPAVRAHQAVTPKVMTMVQMAPAGTPSCYQNGIPTAACIEKGRKLFETGTFGGNGRTCASCHPASNNFTLDVPFIRKLPASDKLFVHEQVPALAELETPLLRKYGLICENLDGFPNENGKRSCVMRSVITTEGMAASITPDAGAPDRDPVANGFAPARPFFPLKGTLGWAGDGSPGDGSLRSFAIGAVVQHFPKTLNRTPGIDFRLPTEDELDAMEAFQLTLGRREEMNLNPDPFAQNKAFNCKAYDGTNAGACAASPVFELKTLAQLTSWRPQDVFKGQLVSFNDMTVTQGQLLFFGGIPSKPVNGVPTNIRSCAGCHIQAGAGSALAPNTPQPAANRQRATGASLSPASPVCLAEAQGMIYNADGGFGAGASGFPTNGDGSPQDCASSFSTAVFPNGSCFKEFRSVASGSPTEPPLSNAAFAETAKLADVGVRKAIARQEVCGGAVANDQVYLTGTGFFSTPSIIEAASTIPLFHNNIVATVEDSVRFYATDVFDQSPSGGGNRLVLDAVTDGQGQNVNIATSVGAFLRAINALNNLKISAEYVVAARTAAQTSNTREKVRNAKLALKRATDAMSVLTVGGPTTRNYLGGPQNLFTSAPGVASSIQTAKSKLSRYGSSDSAFGKLTSTDLKLANNQIAAACKSMLAAEAASFCPATLP